MLDLRDRILRCGRQMQRAQLLLDPLACVAIHAKSGHLPNGASLAGQSCVPTHPFDCGPEMCKRPGSFMRQRGSPPQDRKSVGVGKSVSVRLELGGGRNIKKKHKRYTE